MPLQRIDVRLCVARLGDAFAHYVTDGHLVVNVEAFCDDVLAVELMADDAGANGVAVKAEEEIVWG